MNQSAPTYSVARRDRVRADQVPQVLDAMRCATELIVAHGLYLSDISITPARPKTRRFDNEAAEWLPALSEIHATLPHAPGELLRWLDLFQAEPVRALKVKSETLFRVRVRRYGYEWRLSSSVAAPGQGPRLPGLRPRWKSHPGSPPRAWISRAELRTALASLGVLRREPGAEELVPLQLPDRS
ncbi:hypothetical protein [Micromonospora sp. RV43]|uniref:hypothetical protein n=1 Tax=Micromonospora sp. RV43 TaxID=1661387 RepID=UPI00064B9281|nr:hypothetical protein [Micromonospora sp. RV43]